MIKQSLVKHKALDAAIRTIRQSKVDVVYRMTFIKFQERISVKASCVFIQHYGAAWETYHVILNKHIACDIIKIHRFYMLGITSRAGAKPSAG